MITPVLTRLMEKYIVRSYIYPALYHGDALCLADTDYQAFRREVRGVAWQQAFLARPLTFR
mgnify:CR=1 FL=1